MIEKECVMKRKSAQVRGKMTVRGCEREVKKVCERERKSAREGVLHADGRVN